MMIHAPLFRIFFLAFAAIFCIAAAPAAAQNDSKGRDFWLTFPPNFHSPNTSDNDSLFIFIVADEPTSGTIEYFDRTGRQFTQPFTIADITQIYTFGLSWTNFELRGFNTLGGISANDPNNQNEKIARQSFHITTTKDVGIYAVEQASYTSEAFLVLPTDVLGKEYFVVAYNSDGSVNQNGTNISNSSTPSQFAIVATEDNTNVTIYPKVPTRVNGSNVQNITLQTSDVYLVQAQISSAAGYSNDLTGTRIVSSKPVALFGGHQRTKLPIEQTELQSRDCLIEQIPPLTTWGKRVLLTPYPQPAGATSIGSDIYRVLAAEDSTDIIYNGLKLTSLKKGGIYQGNLTTSAEITSPKPILVVQYKKTSGDNNNPNSREYSDPFMMILPPAEQFLPFYRFINSEGYDDQHLNGVYRNYQFATVITPKSVQASVRFDGAPVDQTLFKDIGNTGYAYAQIKTVTGAHTVQADSGIGLLVYGYGEANSYGYVGGMSYRPINRKMPDLILSNECFGFKGVAPGVYDGGNRLANIGLDPAVPVENVSATLPALPPTRDSAHFRVALQDIYRDGACGIAVTDTLGFVGKTKIEVCGFTVGVGAAGVPVAYLPDNYAVTRSVNTGRTKCFDLEIINYGKCRTAIQAVRVAAGGASIVDPASVPSQPFTLDAGQRLPLRLCVLATADGQYTDTIIIQGVCADRRVIAINIQSRSDKNPPAITKNGDPCKTTFDVQVTELQDGDSGIEFAEVIDSVNCSVQPTTANADARGYKITVIDPYQDAFFAVRARDSIGNTTIIRDTIPGFTMQIRSLPPADPMLLDYDVRQAGTFNCDSLELFNYGAFPLVFENIVLDVNIAFSIPPAQMPLMIPPKESRKIAVCYTPMIVRKENWYDSVGLPDNDAIGIHYRCLTTRILLKGTPSDILRDGNSRCDLPVYSIANVVPQHYYLEQGYPNPAGLMVRFGFGVPVESDVRIVLTDISGAEISVLAEGHFPAGKYVGGILTRGLLPGVYFYRLTANGQAYSQSIIVE